MPATLSKPLPDYGGSAGVPGPGIGVLIGNNDTGASASTNGLDLRAVVFRGLYSEAGGAVSADLYGYTAAGPLTVTITLVAKTPFGFFQFSRVRSGPTDLLGNI